MKYKGYHQTETLTILLRDMIRYLKQLYNDSRKKQYDDPITIHNQSLD